MGLLILNQKVLIGINEGTILPKHLNTSLRICFGLDKKDAA